MRARAAGRGPGLGRVGRSRIVLSVQGPDRCRGLYFERDGENRVAVTASAEDSRSSSGRAAPNPCGGDRCLSCHTRISYRPQHELLRLSFSLPGSRARALQLRRMSPKCLFRVLPCPRTERQGRTRIVGTQIGSIPVCTPVLYGAIPHVQIWPSPARRGPPCQVPMRSLGRGRGTLMKEKELDGEHQN